jgi:hypothetical protein
MYNFKKVLDNVNEFKDIILDRETFELIDFIVNFHIKNNFLNFDKDPSFFQKIFTSNRSLYTLPSSTLSNLNLNSVSNLGSLSRSITSNQKGPLKQSLFLSTNELNANFPLNQSGKGLGDLSRSKTFKKSNDNLSHQGTFFDLRVLNESFIKLKIMKKFEDDTLLTTDTNNSNNYFSKKTITESFKNFTDLVFIENLNITDNLFISCRIYILLQIIFDYFNSILNVIRLGTLDIISEKSTVPSKNVYRAFPEKNIYLKLYLSIINTKYYCPIQDDLFLFNKLKPDIQNKVAQIKTPFISKTNSREYVINNYIQKLRVKTEDKVIESNPNSCMYFQFVTQNLSNCQSIFVLSYYESYFRNNQV